MSTATEMCSNLLAEKKWKMSNDGSKPKEEVNPNAKFLMLTAQIEDLKKLFASGKKGGEQHDAKLKSWRFSNSENKS